MPRLQRYSVNHQRSDATKIWIKSEQSLSLRFNALQRRNRPRMRDAKAGVGTEAIP